MGWWRTLLPCCGQNRKTPTNAATFSCWCCGTGAGMHHDQGDVPAPGDVEKTYVFLENYPTETKYLNPVVPFVGELPVTLDPGRIILIEGIVKPFAVRMSVNLACGSHPTADLSLHLNPRFEQNLVVRNYRLSNRWGEEETSSARRFPFKRGQQFQMQILATEDEFMVAFDGEHFCAYTFRLPLIRTQLIQINGDVDITSLEYKMIKTYPLSYDGVIRPNYKIDFKRSLSQIAKRDVDTPFSAQLAEGLKIGNEIVITGRVKLLPHLFFINLQDGEQIWPHPTISLHINPRYKSGASGGVVINAWVEGFWGSEEKWPIHFFRPGRTFIIKIACEESRYSIIIDNAEPMYFAHRTSVDPINTIYVHGDVVLKDIKYTTSDKTESIKKDQTEKVKKDQIESVKKDQTEKVKKDQTESVKKDQTESVKKNQTEKVKKDQG